MKKENWNLNEIPDLTGKTILVTGGNSGLGYESVKAFALNGARVIMASRSLEKGKEAKAEILKNDAKGSIDVLALDLMNLESIINFTNQVNKNYKQLNVLLNNAGIMTPPYGLTKDGFESQIGTNHLGHFVLTAKLFNLLKSTPESRIVNVSSIAHKQGKMDFSNILYENGKGYTPMRAYGRSKLANLLFTYELNRRLIQKEVPILSLAAHPGVSETNLIRFIDKKPIFKILKPIVGLFMQSASQGALPQIRASVDAAVKSGEYFGPDGFNEMKGKPVRVKSTAASHNEDDARQLWEISEELTRAKFEI